MKLRKEVSVLFLGTYVLSACGGIAPTGGGSTNGSGLPNVSFSPTSLTFNDEAVDTVSPSQPVTLTNSGTAPLRIVSVVASGNFAQTNTCGPTLAPGANCTTNVAFTPSTADKVSGMLSVTDNAPGSRQTVALSGTGATAQDTLTGYCAAELDDSPWLCGGIQDLTRCPVGQQASTPTWVEFCPCPYGGPQFVDSSRTCGGTASGGHRVVTGVLRGSVRWHIRVCHSRNRTSQMTVRVA